MGTADTIQEQNGTKPADDTPPALETAKRDDSGTGVTVHGGGEEPSEEPIADRYNPAARLALFVLTAAVAIAILLIIEITRPVPITVALLTCIFVPFVTFVMPWRKPTVALARAWHLTVIVVLAGITAIAVWLGFQDVIWPESLPAQILGVFFTAAGTITLVGALLVAARALPAAPKRALGDVQNAYIAAAATAGLYVTLTLVIRSFRYQPDKAWLLAILAVCCLVLAIQAVPAGWAGIGRFVKGAGITLALLGTAAGFWFQSIYLPENTLVGIQYGVSVSPAVASGSDRLVTLDFTMEDQSSVTAVALGSMVIVRGLIYPDSGASGNQTSRVLKVLQPITDNSYVFPNDVVSHDFDVVIPAIPKEYVAALQVQTYVLYARSTDLKLGNHYRSNGVSSSHCSGSQTSGSS